MYPMSPVRSWQEQRVCDRTVVMFHGSVQGELVGDEMNEQAIMRLATGGQV